MSILDRKMYPKWHQNGAKWPPGISRKIPETAPGATKERYDAASSPQDHPRAHTGPLLDPQSTLREPQKTHTGPPKHPQSIPKGPPKQPHRTPKVLPKHPQRSPNASQNDLQIRSLFKLSWTRNLHVERRLGLGPAECAERSAAPPRAAC